MIQKFELYHFGNSAQSGHEKNSKQLKLDALIVSFEMYYISEYIQRHLRRSKPLKELTKNIDKKDKIININIGMDFPKREIELFKESRALSIHYEKIYEEIKPLRGNNRSEKILKMLENILPDIEQYIKGIQPILQDIINDFRKENYQNRWEHAKKKLTSIGTAKLICELTIFDFTLKLVIEDKNKSILFQKTIIKSLPDSLLYYNKFKSLEIIDTEIQISQRLKNTPIFSISIDEAIELGIDNSIVFEKKNEPKWWVDFKECMQKNDGVLCPNT